MVIGKMHASTSGKMKYDTDWDNTSTSYGPLQILALIKNTIIAKTKDPYKFATIYKQECSIYSFSHNTFSNDQWYELFNTKIYFGSDIGVTQRMPIK